VIFVDAAAIIAILSDEPEAGRCAAAIQSAGERLTSPLAVWESAVALAREDKFGVTVERAAALVVAFLEQRNIAARDLPEASASLALSLEAAQRFRGGRARLNLADCFHYACARHYGAAMLSTADEFRFTDLETVP
jgi:ribonuclease VapC